MAECAASFGLAPVGAFDARTAMLPIADCGAVEEGAPLEIAAFAEVFFARPMAYDPAGNPVDPVGSYALSGATFDVELVRVSSDPGAFPGRAAAVRKEAVLVR